MPKHFKRLLTVLSILCVSLACGQTLELLHSFSGPDGAEPLGRLAQGSDGNFYGTTSEGGVYNEGTVFRITPDGELTTLLSFDGTNGAMPWAALLPGNEGEFYGTTWTGNSGVSFYGTLFRITPAGELTTLCIFEGANGAQPSGHLVRANNGDIYGTTMYGGTGDYGTIFRATTNGVITAMVSFNRTNGSYPKAGILQGTNGAFYGATHQGGPLSDSGTIFTMAIDGTWNTLFSFDGINGELPTGLVSGTDGNFYGVTQVGGPARGTAFRITPAGDLIKLASFDSSIGNPQSELIQAIDGNFYGISCLSQSNVVFRITAAGSLTMVASFAHKTNTCTMSTLMQGTDGNIYITDDNCGEYKRGAIYKLILPPKLGFTHTAGQVVLSWATNAVDFTLQLSSDLTSDNWTNSSHLPLINGDRFVVTNAITSSAQFYRLKK